MKYLIFIFFILLPIFGYGGSLLPPYQAKYVAYVKGTKAGDVIEKLAYVKHFYKYTLKTNLHYLLYNDYLFQGVRGEVKDQQFVPVRYYYGSKRYGPYRSYAIKKGYYDNLTYRLQMRLDLLAGKSAFSFPIMTNRKTVVLSFHVIQRQYLFHSLIGPLETVVVSAVRPDGITITYWLAKKYQYLIVKGQQRYGRRVLATMSIWGQPSIIHN